MQVRILPPQLVIQLEVIRPDEGPVLKTGAAYHRCGFESHGFRLHSNKCPWPSGKGARFPPWTGGFDSRRALFQMRGSFCW